MEKVVLQSMTNFVLEQIEIQKESIKQLEKIGVTVGYGFSCRVQNYANFLKQPLTLGMFVPCDLDGNVLQPEYVGGREVIYDEHVHDAMMDKVKEYQEAKERVLFEGFELKDYPDVISFYTNWGYFSWYKTFLHFIDIENNYLTRIETVENLLKYRLELNESAKKQIGI